MAHVTMGRLVGTLPGRMLDRATNGEPTGGRAAIVKAVRTIMLSAHRNDVPFPDVHALLTDASRHKLAAQIVTGKGGRPIPRAQRDKFLREHWESTAELVAATPAWTPGVAAEFVEFVRDQYDGAATLTGDHRAVMGVVIDLAEAYGTTRPAVPVRTVAERTGLSRNRSHRILLALCAVGEWLALAQRGNYRGRRANLYRLAPGLWDIHGGLQHLSPTTHMSHPYVPPEDGAAMPSTLTLTLSPEDEAAVLDLIAQRRADERAQQRPNTPGGVADLAARRRGSAS